MICGVLMADAKNFLDNLKNFGLVLSVALENIQENGDGFVKDATGKQVTHFERSITQIRILAEQMEREFNKLEYLIAKRPRGSA
jgi:hypothetical protein